MNISPLQDEFDRQQPLPRQMEELTSRQMGLLKLCRQKVQSKLQLSPSMSYPASELSGPNT